MLRLRALAALAAVVAAGGIALAEPQEAGMQESGPDAAGKAQSAPEARKLKLRVGEHVDFAAPPDTGGSARWTLDGTAVATSPTWTFAPTAADVGPHVVSLAVSDGTTHTTRRWDVRVTPPRLPRITTASPDAATVSTEVDRPVELRFDAKPGSPGETVEVRWTVDGAFAGEGNTLRWSASEPANLRARAIAVGSFGAAVARDWLILVRMPPPTTTTTQPSGRAAAEPPTEAVGPPRPQPQQEARQEQAQQEQARPEDEAQQPETNPEPVPPPTTGIARAETPTTVPPPPPPPPPPPAPQPSSPPPTSPPAALASRGPAGAAGADDEVRRLLDRYAAAWRNHDVGELRRIGQVTSDSQAADLERYFAKVEDLDVEVHVIDIQNEGDRSTVRFTRRDRFRDPTGRLVTQESPPIEKHVVRSSDGLRFESR